MKKSSDQSESGQTVEEPTVDLMGEVTLVGEKFCYVEGVIGLQKCLGRCQRLKYDSYECQNAGFSIRTLDCNRMSTVYSHHLSVVGL